VGAYRDLDPEAVLRVSFLRGLRVLRAKPRRRDAGTAKCRSLDSLRSLGVTAGLLRSKGATAAKINLYLYFPLPAEAFGLG
jgi:hypothetical protein